MNGQTHIAAARDGQNGEYAQAPLAMEAANIDFAALGWETESFLSSLNTGFAGFMEGGYQDSDLFC